MNMNATANSTAHRGSPLYECEILEGLAARAASEHDWNKSQELLFRAVEIRKAAAGASDPGVGSLLDKLGVSYLEAKVFDKAMNCFTEAEQILQNAYYAGHASLAPVLEHQADCF